jgi:hypothetical protein
MVDANAQTDTSKWLRAFPITDYIVDLNDSFKVVQLEMPEGLRLKEKQLGVVFGLYDDSASVTVQKGYGNCHLIKGVYHYFPIGHNESGSPLKKGDLLYTFVEKSSIFYGLIPRLASHFIRLKNVHDEPLFDRYLVFANWTEAGEGRLIDSLVTDIRFTGEYFSQQEDGTKAVVIKGKNSGLSVLELMKSCEAADVRNFLSFILSNPRKYAGHEWKIAEIYATWILKGSPQ